MSKSIWCRLGFHKWAYSRPVTVRDIYPGPFGGYENPRRKCMRAGCSREQYWLPGYGGSELGCWCDYRLAEKNVTEYYEKHRRCPQCGSEGVFQTYAGKIAQAGEEFVDDINEFKCNQCGRTGKVDELK